MSRVLFRDVSIIDGTGKAPFAGEVLVEGNRIKAIAPRGASVAAGDAEIVEGGGATLMPGLVEAHAHPSFCNTETIEGLGAIPPEEHTLLTAKYCRELLNAGFTSIMSAAAAKPRLDIAVRNAINAGDIPGPRMLAASPEMTITGGLGDVRLHHLYRDTFGYICDGQEEFRKAARLFVREGVDTLKINPSGDEGVPSARARHTVMTEAEVRAVCEVAKSREKRVAAHARTAESVKMCLRNGVDIIYHATLADEEALDMLEAAKDRVFVAPTLGLTWITLRIERPFRMELPADVQRTLEFELENGAANMRSLLKRGVRVLPGGDYGFSWNPIPTNARDLEHFVNLLGMSPLEAIVSATKWGGEIMMRGEELGQVKEGYLADLLLVDGDPSKDIRILQDRGRLLAIMQDGKFRKRPALGGHAERVAAE